MPVDNGSRDIVKPHLRDHYQRGYGVNVAIQAVLLKADVFAYHYIGDFQSKETADIPQETEKTID